MKTYSNISSLINDLPKYMIPYDHYDLYWYIKIKNNSKYNIIIPKNVIHNLQDRFGNTNDNYLNKRLKQFSSDLKKNVQFRFFRSGKILYYDDDIPEDMIQCDNCGKIWNGNAQCNCYLYNSEFGDLEFGSYKIK
jgi:hypothetical protein